MALGNFAIQEIIYGVAEDFAGNLLYTLDQLSSASIEISADPTEITDKNGNVIRQVYRSKTGTFTATSALLSPAIINSASGSSIKTGSQVMPKIVIKKAGDTIDLTAEVYEKGTVKIIGISGNGVSGDAKVEADLISDGSIVSSTGNDILTLPIGAGYDQYLVKFDRTVNGESLVNRATDFPKTIRLTLFAAVIDPCDDEPKAAYVHIPSFQPDPSMTISLDAENTEMDYTGQLQVDFCSGLCANLYEIYFPEKEAVVIGNCEE